MMQQIDEFVSRRAVRHLIVRRRNERIAADERDDRWPVLISMHPDTLGDVLVDGDPAEARTVDFEGREFMGIPILEDPTLPRGEVAVRWPDPVPVAPPEGDR